MSHRHVIPATPENMVLGYLDATTPPILHIESGDVVTLSSFPAGGMESLPEISRVPAVYLAALKALPAGPGPHFITGPIHVKGAEPGDTLEIEILDAKTIIDLGVRRDLAFAWNAAGRIHRLRDDPSHGRS